MTEMKWMHTHGDWVHSIYVNVFGLIYKLTIKTESFSHLLEFMNLDFVIWIDVCYRMSMILTFNLIWHLFHPIICLINCIGVIINDVRHPILLYWSCGRMRLYMTRKEKNYGQWFDRCPLHRISTMHNWQNITLSLCFWWDYINKWLFNRTIPGILFGSMRPM